jgi:hypothetical protein
MTFYFSSYCIDDNQPNSQASYRLSPSLTSICSRCAETLHVSILLDVQCFQVPSHRMPCARDFTVTLAFALFNG